MDHGARVPGYQLPLRDHAPGTSPANTSASSASRQTPSRVTNSTDPTGQSANADSEHGQKRLRRRHRSLTAGGGSERRHIWCHAFS
jgi:hypothetical protein